MHSYQGELRGTFPDEPVVQLMPCLMLLVNPSWCTGVMEQVVELLL